MCLSLVSSILRLKKVAMGYSSTGNPRRLSQRRSPLCGNYERFNNSNGQDELQKRMFSISSPRRVQRKLSLSGSTTAMEKMKNRKVLSISNPRKSHRRFSLSDSTTVIAKARFQNLRYAFEIHQLEKAIRDFVQYQISAQVSLKLRNLISEFKSLRHLYDFGGVDERKVKLTNDPCEFAMMGQQMGSDDMVDVVFDEAPTYNYSGSGKPNFVVGLEKNIFNLKPILLQRKVSVFGIQHIGGVGKTTMAMALCNDQEIKGAFRNNIIYITYPLSPNLMKISETMWCFSKQYHFHPRPTVPKPEGNF